MKIFVTGASGWIGSAVVPELITAGHSVIGLARSDESAKALENAGAEVTRGTLDDIDTLKAVAAASDGVLHLAFKHDIAFSGDFIGAAAADRKAVEAFGEALAGTDKPLVIASGVIGLAPGRLATEKDGLESTPESESMNSGPQTRSGTAHIALSLAEKGVRSSVVRLAPTVHGDGDNGFIPTLIKIAREKGTSAYIGDGSSRWPAVHRLDAAYLFRLAVEGAPAGSVLHAVADEGVPTHTIADVIGRHLGVPIVSIPADSALDHFGFLGALLQLDSPVSNKLTRTLLAWEPTHPGLIEDLDEGHYFATK